MKKTHYLKWLCLIIGAVFAVQAQAQYVLQEIYVTDFVNPPTAPATITSVKDCAIEAAPGWATGYTSTAHTTSSTGEVRLDFTTPLDLTSNGTNQGRITLHWGATSNRPVTMALNGGSFTQIDAVTSSGDRSKVRLATYDIPNGTTSISSINVKGSGGGNSFYLRIVIETWINPAPVIELTSGEQNAIGNKAEMEKIEIVPVVYTYKNATLSDVTYEWCADATCSSVLPSSPINGVDLASTANNTITLSGTPDENTVGTYYYRISATTTEGSDSEIGSIEIIPYVTPTPIITHDSASGAETQSVKGGLAITDIVYTFKNIGADPTITGLTDGLTSAYDPATKTLTISGTVDTRPNHEDYPYTINYTIEVEPLDSGFTGTLPTANGTITVTNPNPPKKQIRQCS